MSNICVNKGVNNAFMFLKLHSNFSGLSSGDAIHNSTAELGGLYTERLSRRCAFSKKVDAFVSFAGRCMRKNP